MSFLIFFFYDTSSHWINVSKKHRLSQGTTKYDLHVMDYTVIQVSGKVPTLSIGTTDYKPILLDENIINFCDQNGRY